jgi:hypothetical protein
VGRLRGDAEDRCDRGVRRRVLDGASARGRRIGLVAGVGVGGWSMLASGPLNTAVWRVGRRGWGVARPGRASLTGRMGAGCGGRAARGGILRGRPRQRR